MGGRTSKFPAFRHALKRGMALEAFFAPSRARGRQKTQLFDDLDHLGDNGAGQIACRGQLQPTLIGRTQPMRLFRSHQHRHGDGYILTMRSRFIPDALLELFERQACGRVDHAPGSPTDLPTRVNVAARMRERWD